MLNRVHKRLGRGIAVVHEDGAASAPVEGGLAAAAVAAAAAAAGGGGSVAAAVAARAAAGGAVDAYSLQAEVATIWGSYQDRWGIGQRDIGIEQFQSQPSWLKTSSDGSRIQFFD